MLKRWEMFLIHLISEGWVAPLKMMGQALPALDRATKDHGEHVFYQKLSPSPQFWLWLSKLRIWARNGKKKIPQKISSLRWVLINDHISTIERARGNIILNSYWDLKLESSWLVWHCKRQKEQNKIANKMLPPPSSWSFCPPPPSYPLPFQPTLQWLLHPELCQTIFT